MLKKICLICAAVVLTWATMLVLMWWGFGINRTILGILMGMSVGAIATKYSFGLVWKASAVVLGFLSIWYLINDKPIYTFAAVVAMLLLTGLFRLKLNNKKGAPQSDRFKDCC